MAKKYFRWLLSQAITSTGATLVPNMVYGVEIFGEKIVSDWVKSGAAEYVEEVAKEKKKKKEE